MALITMRAQRDPLRDGAHQKKLEDIEDDLAKHFGAALSADEKEILRLCRQLRNKVLHSDFRAARERLKELGVETGKGGVVKVDFPVGDRRAVCEEDARCEGRNRRDARSRHLVHGCGHRAD
jgi:hypothetical protein